MTDDMEKRLHDAFEGVHVPQGLEERTLARIEAARTAEEEASQKDVPALKELAQTTPTLVAVPGGAQGATDGARAEARRRPRRHRRRLVAAIAACLVVVLVGIAGVWWASLPYAYVGIDVNPSIELGINRFDRVADTRSYNEDGAELLQAVDVAGMSYEEALDALAQELQGYIDAGGIVEVTIVCDDEGAATNLETTSMHCLDAAGIGQVHCSHADHHERAEAEAAGMGIGKYRVWRELVDAGVDLSADEAAQMTMRELVDLATANGVTLSGDAGHAAEHALEHEGAGVGNGAGSGNGTSDSGAGSGSPDNAGASTGSGNSGASAGAGAHHQEQHGRHHDG